MTSKDAIDIAKVAINGIECENELVLAGKHIEETDFSEIENKLVEFALYLYPEMDNEEMDSYFRHCSTIDILQWVICVLENGNFEY
jgi:hypothetical protein